MGAEERQRSVDLLEKLGPAFGAIAAVAVQQAVSEFAELEVAAYVAPAVGALVAVLVYVLSTVLPSTLRAQSMALCAVVLLLAGSGFAAQALVRYQQTSPGRTARNSAEGWDLFVADDFDVELRLEQESGGFGEGFGVAGGGTLVLVGQSEISHAVPWTVYDELPQGADFYQEVRARLDSGPGDIGCGLVFAWQNGDSWWGFRVVDKDSVLISRFEGVRNGRMDARTFFGPTSLGFGDVRSGVKLGVLSRGTDFDFYVDDRRVVTLDESVLLDPSGAVAPFAIDSASLYRASYQCSFESLRVWVDNSSPAGEAD